MSSLKKNKNKPWATKQMNSMLKVAFSTVLGYTALFTVSMKTLQKIVTMLLKSKEFLGVDN